MPPSDRLRRTTVSRRRCFGIPRRSEIIGAIAL